MAERAKSEHGAEIHSCIITTRRDANATGTLHLLPSTGEMPGPGTACVLSLIARIEPTAVPSAGYGQVG